MPKITAFPKGLIGRVKKHMAAVVVGIGIFCATSGLYVIVEHSQYKIWGLIIGILGVILVLIGYILSYVRDKEERKERIIERTQHQVEWVAERTEFRELFQAMIESQRATLAELKKLNRDKEDKG